MVIVTSFKQKNNTETGIIKIISNEEPLCPLCKGCLVYRDSRIRKAKNIIGICICYLLRRLRCVTCNKIHIEIPDILLPYKHYDSKTIQSVIDGDEDATGCAADDSTIRRWKTSFTASASDISQRLTSIYAIATDEKVPAEKSAEMLSLIKGREKHWLAFVMALLINNGHKLCTRFAFCPAGFCSILKEKSKINAKGGELIDKTFNDSS